MWAEGHTTTLASRDRRTRSKDALQQRRKAERAGASFQSGEARRARARGRVAAAESDFMVNGSLCWRVDGGLCSLSHTLSTKSCPVRFIVDFVTNIQNHAESTRYL